MSGTRAGGLKAKLKLLEKDPNFFQNMGRIGGKKQVPKGFALMDAKKRSAAGVKGGTASRRNKKKV